MKRTKKEMKKIYEEFNVFFEVSGYDLFFFETQDFNIIVKENLDEIKRKEIVKVLSTRFDVHHKTIYNFIERYYYDTLEYFDMCNDELQRILEK